MGERKHVTRTDSRANLEAKQLGPYPPWETWKHVLFREIGEDIFDEFDPRVQDLLHRTYVIGRKKQLGLTADNDVEKAKKLENDLGGIDKIYSNPKVGRAFQVIYSRVKP